ncbi:MAG TPA: methionine synthase [Candidatus Binatia bacterium]|nr:methionine synthase [Candidatus Binatia bacterium]
MRVDQVGSLLRPAKLKEIFARYSRGAAGEEELRRVQEDSIRGVIAKQEEHNLPVLTDGEFRRTNFMESFSVVAGVEQWQTGVKTLHQVLARQETTDRHEQRGQDPILLNRKPVTERLRLVRNRLLEDYQFASSLTTRPVKLTLIGPDRISQGYDSDNSRTVYAGIDDFLADVISVERQIISELADAGCRYVQIDGPGYTAYVDGPSLQAMRARGEEPMANMERSISADNAIIADFPELTFGLHMCRGNRQSMWHRQGTYDAIAERLFNGLHHQRLLLEYDTERAGSFEPLRFVPKSKVVVLGLITTKIGRVETVDELKRRIEEAAHYVPIEQLALSPQCGFASSIAGNLLSEDEQWRKFDVMLQTAEQVWG